VKDDSLLKKYEEEVARLEALKATLKVEERRLRWWWFLGRRRWRWRRRRMVATEGR